MPHVVLLGDSIFDNAAYTRGGPDVITQLREILPPGWRATLGAVDGATTGDVTRQLAALPRDATHLVLSIGGNDALGHAELLDLRVRSSAEALSRVATAAAGFESRYRRAIAAARERELPLTICTIYDGSFPDPDFQRIASTALSAFNDAILRVAFEAGLTVIDLRLVCNEPRDYANPIEPSSHGGAKIARSIQRAIELAPAADGVTRVIAG
jgi:hypothetical protein